MTTLTTLNVSRAQVEEDLRAGKSVEEIAQDWSEPRANVFAIKRALDDASAAPPVAPPAPAPSTGGGADSIARLVDQASKSRHTRTRNLGAKLDLLVEELCSRLHAEHAESAEREAKRKEREVAAAEVARLEEQLRAARAKLGGKSAARTSSTKTADNPHGNKSTRPVYDGGPTSSVIREWAASADVDCPPHGMLPHRVIEAYRAAVGDGA